MGITLPQAFTDKMRRLLGEEYDAWEASYENERRYGLRVNTLKLQPEAFAALTAMSGLKPVEWAEGGFYYPEEARPGRHPHYHAGLYYIQEPSAMVPAELLGVMPGDRVLDLCAAPGGKSTQLAAKLKGEGLLVANDNAAERTKALAKNIELAGVRNAVILNEEPERLAGRFPGFFTKILVDAPCSGEGMFRKDESMIAQWEKHSVERCSLMQRDILRHAADMLAPGGTLVYSTCTFSPEENEARIAELLSERPELSVEPVPLRFGWAPGRPEWAGGTDAGLDPAVLQAVGGTVRLWPHRTEGEGHYAAVIRHTGATADRTEAEAEAYDSRREQSIAPAARVSTGGKGRSRDRGMSERPLRSEAPGGKRGDRSGPALRKRDGEAGRSGNSGAHPDPAEQWKEFRDEHAAAGVGEWTGVLTAFGARLYLQPVGMPTLDGLRVVRAGWYLGEAGTRRFEPSQALALGMRSCDALRVLRLNADEADTVRYLRGDTLRADAARMADADGRPLNDAGAKGWVLMLVDGYSVGWGKWDNGVLKNGLAPGWRRMG